MEENMKKGWKMGCIQNNLPDTPFDRHDPEQIDQLFTYAFTYEF